jgi:threonyl-tRNA synthetase
MSEKNDHKKVGRELGLFSFSRKVPGVTYWWPKGNTLFNTIVDDLKGRLQEQGYQDIKTPAIISVETLRDSGHLDNYREKLFFTGNEKELKEEKQRWCLKPMNCPGSIVIFKEETRSYRDLPLKLSEVGTVYRYEQPGEVNGLLRTRALTIDDGHIYCTKDQIKDELVDLIDFIQETYQRYGFRDITVEFSTRPQKSIGTDQQWQRAEEGLQSALKSKKIEYQENRGEGAFYGPKIDFHVKDSLNRSWQMGTVQLDFSMAERLKASYIDQTGQSQTPIIIHRAILGSVERFMAVLIESTGGSFPFWLAPVQIKILPISGKFLKYGQQRAGELAKAGFRVEVDDSDQTLSKKIREGERAKFPYLLIVGEKEKRNRTVAVRSREAGDLGQEKLAEFIERVGPEKS